jgi:deoxyribodipyrimidine photo-lyase
MSKQNVSVFWFRRDLRLDDNAGLYFALKENEHVLPIFIFDPTILNELEDKNDRRVDFIHQCISELEQQLNEFGSSIKIVCATPLQAFNELSQTYVLKNVYANHDYEPRAKERDEEVKNYLEGIGCDLRTYKDQVIFEKSEVTKDDGKPYTIFTPYSRKWKAKLTEGSYKSFSTEKYFGNFFKTKAFEIPSLKKIGFEKTDIEFKNTKSNAISHRLLAQAE